MRMRITDTVISYARIVAQPSASQKLLINMNKDTKIKIATLVVAILIAMAISLAINYPIMLLWNWPMPKLFHLPELSFWEMYGASLLMSVLTSCFRKPNK